MHRKIFSFVYAVNYIIQAGFSMIFPAGLVILGGWLLTEKCGAGRWVMIVAIVFGVLCGVYSLFRFLMSTMNHVDPTQKKKEETDERKQ